MPLVQDEYQLPSVDAILITAAFSESLRPLAVAAGLVSMLSFVLIAYLVGGYNTELGRSDSSSSRVDQINQSRCPAMAGW